MTIMPVENFQICGEGRSGHAIEVPAQITCRMPEHLATSPVRVPIDLWIPRTKPAIETAHECMKRRTEICTYMNFLGSQSVLSEKTWHTSVSVPECTSAVTTRNTSLGSLVQIEQGLWSTNITREIDFKWCCTTRCSSVMNFVLEIGQVASWTLDTMSTDLGDLGGCSPRSGNCRLDDSTVVWNTTKFDKFCPMELKGHYNATLADEFLVIQQLQSAFSFDKPFTECEEIGSNAQLTDQGVVVKFDQAHLDLAAAHPLTQAVDNVGTGSWDPANAKLNYLEERIVRMEIENFQAVWTEMCRQGQRYLDLIIQLLRLDATTGARAYLQRSDISAAYTGDALTIWSCTPVAPTKIHYDYRVNDDCFRDLPVQVGDKVYFAVPGGPDLHAYSTPTDCNHQFAGIFKRNDEWRTETGPTHVSYVPLEINWNESVQVFQFKTPPVFHDRLAAEARFDVASLRNSIYKTSQLEKTVQRLVNYTAKMSADPEALYQTIAGTGKAVGNVVESYSRAVGGLFSTAVNSTTDGINNLLKGPLQIFVNMLVILAVFMVLLAGGYVYFNRWLQYRQTPAALPLHGSEALGNELLQMARRRSIIDENQYVAAEAQPRQATGARLYPSLEGVKIGTVQGPDTSNEYIPHITVRVDGQIDVCAMVDSGAAYSLLSSRIARRVENLERHVSGIHLVAANGLPVPTEGGAFINVSVGNISETFYAFIQPDTATDLLLGTNFLARFRTVTLSYVDSSVILDGTKISAIGLPYNGPKSRGAIVLDENIVVPARSRLRFSAPAAAIFSDGSEVVLEPRKDAYQHYGIYVAGTINRVYNRRIFLEVLNGTNDDKTLYAGSTIGTIRLYQSDTTPMAQVNRTLTATPQIDLEYLKQAVDLSDTDLTDKEKAALIHVLADYPQLYATSRNAAGTTTLVKHRIDTGDAKPIKARPFRMAPKERDLINEEIDRLVTEGIVRPSQSEWSSNIVLVRKKDGSHRMCVDYRNLNSVTRKDVYPLPRIDDILDTLRGMKYFCVIDQANAYHAVEIEEEDKSKTAFASPTGLFEFNRLAFGLCNSPATYQRLVDVLMSGLQWQVCLTYLDDLLIFAKNHTEMLDRLRQVLNRLSRGGLKLRLEKCRFFQKKLKYLGHVISEAGVQPDPDKVDAILNISVPKTPKQLKSFLGLPGYYRKFIKDCSKKCEPLTRLLKKNVKFEWSAEQQNAFEGLKQALVSAPILAHPDFTKKFILQTDASIDGIGGVLTQMGDDGKEHPVAFGSRKLKPYERNYGVTEMEALAVVDFVRYFRPYLYQQEVTVQTDHVAVKQILERPNPNARIARWGLALAGVKLDIQPRRGTANGNADALSRAPKATDASEFDIDKVFDVNFISSSQVNPPNAEKMQQWMNAQNNDPQIEALQANNPGDIIRETNGLLYKKNGEGSKLVVPTIFRL